ncbi:MAG: hypothetical protein K2K54_11715 [Lachnospiraceae bacterium]|nr:hypothetical protein [Lachnospiraceae bacterium]
MEEKNWMEILNKQTQLKEIMELNERTEGFGLVLSREDTELLIEERQNILKQERRVEFGQGILPKLIYAFCDSEYIMQDNYVQSLIRLQEIFYHYKNEMEDEITDDELLNFMKEQFETTCFGDFNYLEGTCLDIFSEAIRAGYQGYQETEGHGGFEELDIVTRWDRELYLEALKDLF